MKKTLIASISWALMLLTGCAIAGDKSSFEDKMKELSRDYFALRPMLATYYGVADKDAGEGIMSRLGGFNPKDERARRAGVKAMIDKIASINVENLTERQKTSLRLVEIEIKSAYQPTTLVEYGSVLGEYGLWFQPYTVNHLSGVHVEFPTYMMDKFTVVNRKQAQAYLARLQQYPEIIAGVIEKIKADEKLGVIPPDFVIDKTINNLELQLEKTAQNHELVTSLKDKLVAAEVKQTNTLVKTATKLIENNYFPATRQLIAALKEIRPFAVHAAGISRLPNGKALYQAMITHMTDTTMTAQEIHQLGLSEVKRISDEMDRLLKTVGYKKGTVGERMTKLLNDPKYIYPNTPAGKAQLFADIQSDLALANEKLPDWFGLLPNQPVQVKAVPDHLAASTSGAFYDAPSQDGSRPGTYWISLYDTSALPSYAIQTLTYHEANPGHHLQAVIGLSDDLSILNTVFYSNAAAEGWGLYAERLAEEMGIYQDDPIDNIGRLQSELHRAVRLVVDTGMHAFGWSREKAIEYSVATEGIHISEATGEIERYAVWPGQALGYKMGELKIIKLRNKAKKQLGKKFDIKVFHDRILEDGALPLNLMEEKINQWLGTD